MRWRGPSADAILRLGVIQIDFRICNRSPEAASSEGIIVVLCRECSLFRMSLYGRKDHSGGNRLCLNVLSFTKSVDI